MSEHSTAYDEVRYPPIAFPQTHPAALETLAFLHGMDPARADRCRVLELGCGSGANLIPMAHQYPRSTFLGLDLSALAIAEGTRMIDALSMANVSLRRCDIMEVGPDLGTFDYVIAHGVYSWVPPSVQDKMMAVFSQNLAQQGVAYVSYNCLPYGHLRRVARDLMRFHTRDIHDPKQRIDQARKILQFAAEATDDSSLYGVLLRHLAHRTSQVPDAVLYHDDLDEGFTAFLFSDVMACAARNRLQFLSEAASSPELHGHLEPMNEFLDRFPNDEIVAREQYMDFLLGRGFRETLLCHADLRLERKIDPSCVMELFIASNTEPESGPIDPAASGTVTFRTGSGASISVDHELCKAAFLHLGEIWPQAEHFDQLLRSAAARLERDPDAAASLAERKGLAQVLCRAFLARTVVLRRTAAPMTLAIHDRPEASALARWQAAHGLPVINLLHWTISLDDEIVRTFLQLLDGTRTIDQLCEGVRHALSYQGQLAEGRSPAETLVSQSTVEDNLERVARLGVLVA
ncbi:methyltransferase regulatory domain-containing protein [Microvirga massiliensis]|uniref:methyltransferase regulatory domain-containing protein n=1 Tax=Microvirga massiliensis TaxID=1033741 RepID=UPI00062B4A92|nr:class I SAM-dependent methyltransferase [Microvirga massiliensis]